MNVIIEWISSVFEVGLTGIQYLLWLLEGLLSLSGVMSESIIILEDVMQFLPTAISSTIVAMCGGLIVFRIFGRS